MARLQSFKRIITEDFEEQYQELVSKLAYSINVFAEDVLGALNKNLTIEDNLNMSKKDISVSVDASGVPTTKLTFSSGLVGLCVGMLVVKATNNTSAIVVPSSCPFITFSDNSRTITVTNISGLQANNKYTLKLLLLS